MTTSERPTVTARNAPLPRVQVSGAISILERVWCSWNVFTWHDQWRAPIDCASTSLVRKLCCLVLGETRRRLGTCWLCSVHPTAVSERGGPPQAHGASPAGALSLGRTIHTRGELQFLLFPDAAAVAAAVADHRRLCTLPFLAVLSPSHRP